MANAPGRRGEMRPVYDVLTAFGFYRLGPSQACALALAERIATPPVVNDAIADVDDAVDAADVSFSCR